LFTGKPPFCDLPVHQIISAHVATVPPLATSRRVDMPVAVSALIARCLEKNPALRPQRADDILSVLDGATTIERPAPPPAPRGLRRRAFGGFALAAAALLGSAIYVVSGGRRQSPPISLAVLPFANIAADTAVDFVADGLAEQVALALARVQGIQVKSLIRARAYRGQLVVDLAEAGSRLKAEYLVTGTVRQDHGRWILSADLSRAADATVLWGESFTLTEDRQAGAAESIASTLVAALRTRFPRSISSAQVFAVNQRTSNSEAYRLYLRGQVKLDRRGQSVRESADLFRAAIREDSLFARAYSGLSLALAFFPYFQGIPPEKVRAELVRTALRALAIDSTLAQPHVALGMAYVFAYDWERAATEYQTAIRLDSRDVEARVQYGRYLGFRGRFAESMRQFQNARALDPSSALVLSHVSYRYYINHQMDSALVESRRALDNDSTNMSSLGLGAIVRLGNNLPDEARRLALASPKFGSTEYVVAKSGDTATARRLLRDLDLMTPQPWASEARRALAYLGLGDTSAALSALERATDRKQSWAAGFSAYEPLYDSIRESARFKVLLRRVGLEPDRR
jgi:TolB-like protein/Tfp pilus assembly protein PilF